jgi:hypothetical protein
MNFVDLLEAFTVGVESPIILFGVGDGLGYW